MHFSTAILSGLALAATSATASTIPSAQHVFANPHPSDPHHANVDPHHANVDFHHGKVDPHHVDPHHASDPHHQTTGFRIPTVHESAILARRILRLSPLGTLSTIFPSSGNARTPSSVAGTSIGLMDYISDCERPSANPLADPVPGNPTILAINIATSFKNVAAGSNISLSLNWVPPHPERFHSPAALPRFSLIGYLEDIPTEEVLKEGVPACFLTYHPDAAAWLPGNRIHTSHWSRLVVQEVYWVGGFGDRAYIGWIPAEEWRSVTEAEIKDAKLPGEKSEDKGWKAWFGWEL